MSGPIAPISEPVQSAINLAGVLPSDPPANPPAQPTPAPTNTNPPVDPSHLPQAQAAVEFADGSVLFYFEQLPPPNADPLQKLAYKIISFVNFIKQYQPDKLNSIRFAERTTEVLYKLDILVRQRLDSSAVEDLIRFATTYLANDPNKPYVQFIILDTLYGQGMISQESYLTLMDKLIEQNPDEPLIIEKYAQKLVEIGKPQDAYALFLGYLNRSAGLPEDNHDVQLTIEKTSSAVQLNKLGDFLSILAKDDPEKYDLARLSYESALSKDSSRLNQIATSAKLGSLLTVLANLDREKGQELIAQAVSHLKFVTSAYPGNPSFELLLGDAYLLQAELEDEPELLAEAEKCYLKFKGEEAFCLRLASLYVKWDKLDKAFEVLEERIKDDQASPLLIAYLAELKAVSGATEESLPLFEKALAGAQNEAQFAEIYTRFLRIKLIMRMKLGAINARYSKNPLKMLLRIMGDTLFFANPVNAIIYLVKKRNPKFTKEEIIRFNRQLDEFENDSIQGPDLAAIATLNTFKELVAAELDENGKKLLEEEVIEQLEGLISSIDNRIGQRAERLSDPHKYEWEKALEEKDADRLFALLAAYFKDLVVTGSFEPQELVAESRLELFENFKDRIKEMLDLIEDEEDKTSAFKLITFFTMLERDVNSLGDSLTGSKKILQELGLLFQKSFESLIEICEEQRDYDSLFNLARGYQRLGGISVLALEAAFSAAEDEEDAVRIAEVAQLAFEISKDKTFSSSSLNETYRTLGLSAFKELHDINEENGRFDLQISLIKDLWRMGSFEDAIDIVKECLDGDLPESTRLTLIKELGYMYLSIGEKGKAAAYLSEEKPEDMVKITGATLFEEAQLRAQVLLYRSWFGGAEIAALEHLYRLNGSRASITWDQANNQYVIEEAKIAKIVINKNNGYGRTKEDVILRELGYAEVGEGELYQEETLKRALAAASRRIRTFNNLDHRVVHDTETNTVTIEVSINENLPYYIELNGSYGTIVSNVGFGVGTENLLGGGEILSGGLSYSLFNADGYRNLEMIGGRIYYKDPHIFCLGESHPVYFQAGAERSIRPDYQNESYEIYNGGRVGLGVYLNPETTVSLSPGLYYVQPQSGEDYFKQGVRIGLDHDTRDDWMMPSEGHIFSAYVEPGAYFGGVPSAGFVKVGASFEQYFAMPGDFVFMFGLRGEAGYNLMGGDMSALGSDRFVRGHKRNADPGPALAAATTEVRTPVLTSREIRSYFAIQPYVFADVGAAYTLKGKTAFGWGAGVGFRMRLAFVGILNFYFGFPGGLNGFWSGFGFGVGTPMTGLE